MGLTAGAVDTVGGGERTAGLTSILVSIESIEPDERGVAGVSNEEVRFMALPMRDRMLPFFSFEVAIEAVSESRSDEVFVAGGVVGGGVAGGGGEPDLDLMLAFEGTSIEGVRFMAFPMRDHLPCLGGLLLMVVVFYVK